MSPVRKVGSSVNIKVQEEGFAELPDQICAVSFKRRGNDASENLSTRPKKNLSEKVDFDKEAAK